MPYNGTGHTSANSFLGISSNKRAGLGTIPQARPFGVQSFFDLLKAPCAKNDRRNNLKILQTRPMRSFLISVQNFLIYNYFINNTLNNQQKLYDFFDFLRIKSSSSAKAYTAVTTLLL